MAPLHVVAEAVEAAAGATVTASAEAIFVLLGCAAAGARCRKSHFYRSFSAE